MIEESPIIFAPSSHFFRINNYLVISSATIRFLQDTTMSQAHPVTFKPARPLPLLITLAVGLGIWLTPAPEGVDPGAWQLLAIFVATIVGIVAKALPIGGMGLLALAVTSGTGTLTIQQTLSGFSSPVIWLIVMAFLVARCFIKTGLGLRIAYLFVRAFGKHTLGLSYSLAATDLLLAPAIPSNTARAGGIIYPVASSLALSFESDPEKGTERRIGSFLILNTYYINLITSAMFLTAIASNPLIREIAAQMGQEISWAGWTKAALVPGILSFLFIPWFVYKIFPPEIKHTPDAKTFAQEHLDQMGAMSKYESITVGVFILLILLWIFGFDFIGIDTTTSAFIGLAVLLLTGVLTWDDVKREHEAWDALIWFPTLLTMATYLNKMGLIAWFSDGIQQSMAGFSWYLAVPILVGIYFYTHYFFASITAHVSSMFAALLGVGIALGAPAMLLTLALAYTSSLMASLTHYGTGCAPILFGSGYVSLKRWWTIGFWVSVVNLIIWLGIGSAWWKLLGIW